MSQMLWGAAVVALQGHAQAGLPVPNIVNFMSQHCPAMSNMLGLQTQLQTMAGSRARSQQLLSLLPSHSCSSHLQVLVSQPGSSVYHVFKSEVSLPKFCMYCPADPESLPPASSTVTFGVTERPARSVLHYMWSVCRQHARVQGFFPACYWLALHLIRNTPHKHACIPEQLA